MDQLSYCIQNNLKEILSLGEDGTKVWKGLDDAMIREIEPLKTTTFVYNTSPIPTKKPSVPVIEHINSMQEWIRTWYALAVNQVNISTYATISKEI